MKLAYIYIQNHKVLENIDIPISGSHKCKYAAEQLTLKFYPNDLDYYQGVDCSAVIGKNGVGKSTILDFLEVAYGGTDSSGIIVWYNEDQKKYHICAVNLYLDECSVESNQEYIFERDFSTFVKYHNIRLIKVNNLTGIETNDFSKKRKSNSFIYDLSLSQYVKGSRKVIAKRTNNLIQYFNLSKSFNKFGKPKVKFTFQFNSSSTAYLRSLMNNKSFISDFIKSEEDLKILEYKIKSQFFNFEFNEYEDFFYQLIDANTLSICNFLSKNSAIQKNHRDKFFIHLVIGMTTKEFNKDYIKKILFDIRRKSDVDHNDLILMTDSIVIMKQYFEIIETLKKIIEIINLYKEQYSWEGDNQVSTFNADFIISLTDLIFSLPSMLSTNFKYGWKGFSTGEFAKLNIFSELYNYIYNQNYNGIHNHLIVIDEVDLYLHPDWQRTFFSELLDFVRVEFPRDTVQIILSTHSPIIISDFLPEDIVSLDRSNGVTKVVESFGFASHITDLYVEGMHLNSTFGEHSKKVLNRLFLSAKNNTLTEQDINLIHKIKSKNIRDMILGYYDKV